MISNLPSKPEEEREKHKKQYEDMIAAAKKKEQKELKLKKKQYAQQIKHEEELHQALKVWNNEILPHWHSMLVKNNYIIFTKTFRRWPLYWIQQPNESNFHIYRHYFPLHRPSISIDIA